MIFVLAKFIEYSASFYSDGLFLIRNLKLILNSPAHFVAVGEKIHQPEYKATIIHISFAVGFDRKKLEQLIFEMVISSTYLTHENRLE